VPAPGEDTHGAAVAVAEAVWRRSPEAVAVIADDVIADDVHHVPTGSDAATLLAEVVVPLTGSGHLVLPAGHRRRRRSGGQRPGQRHSSRRR
jgi:hypothetical protein